MSSTQVIFIVFSGLLGLAAGGVVNLLADDLPFTFRIRPPHYRDNTPRPRAAWLGVTAFLTGKRGDLTLRYPLTEIVLAALFAYIAATIGHVGAALFLMGCVAILALITVIDLEHRMILYAVMIPSYVYAVVGVALFGRQIAPRVEFRDYLIGGVAGFLLFGMLYLGGMLFASIMANARGEDLEEVAFGFGDVLLATLSGLILGWQALIFAMTIAVFGGGLGALIYLSFRLVVRGRYEMFTALPYGQYIVFGTLVMLLWREPIVQFFR